VALYTYRALTPLGKSEKGTVNAASENEAKAMLQQRQIFPLEVKASKPFAFGLPSIPIFHREPRLSVQGLASFSRQFATLLEATIPYDTALEMILQQTADMSFKSVLSDIKGKVVEGSYLADAFSHYPRFFPPMVVSMVRSGETAGFLAMIMHRLADYYENASRLRSKLTSAMVYPVFMMIFSSAVVAFMLTFIVPKITRLFDNFGVTLPLPTRILMALSAAVTDYWWLLLLLALAGGWGASRFLRSPRGQLWRDTMELKLPLWKGLRRKMILQRFTQTLANMLKAGVELKDALVVSSEVLENKIYLQAMERVIFDVQNKGLPLAVAMRQTGIFPEDLCQMTAIGEETATLDVMLDSVSDRFAREVSATVDGASALLEPVMILIMGAVVGFIVISIMLPMLQLNQLVR
jgi:type II secretory pathway component PulF